MKQTKFLIILLISVISCRLYPFNRGLPTSLPGWRIPVYKLLVEESAFPGGWENLYPEKTVTDSTVNRVSKLFGKETESGTVLQTIFRAYTIEDAKNGYESLQSQYTPTPSPFDEIFMLPEEPDEINFTSYTADEWHLGCGWAGLPYCLLTAQYRNYITDIYISLEVEDPKNPGQYTEGLTYEEIEVLLKNVDDKFNTFLEDNPLE